MKITPKNQEQVIPFGHFDFSYLTSLGIIIKPPRLQVVQVFRS